MTCSVYALPPGADFAAAFADGWIARAASMSAADQARALIMVNTAGALTGIKNALADRMPGPGLLPRMVMIPDLADDPSLELQVPPAIAPMRRHLTLTRLVERFLTVTQEAGSAVAPLSAAPDMAEALAFLIDQFHDSGVPLDRLDAALSAFRLNEGAAAHWQDLMLFIDIVRREWPRAREEQFPGTVDARDRQRQAIAALKEKWAFEPPATPVVVAASTGSVASTAGLMAAVSRLPNGNVVLPGFDPAMPAEIWERAGPDHPAGPFRGFLEQLELQPGDVGHWHPAPTGSRHDLLAQALRPAPVTDAWHGAALALSATADDATLALSLIEAPTPRHEAAAIALTVREALEDPEQVISVIAPDAELARQVTAALLRFDITPDDTIGRPLAASPPGVLMQLILAAADGSADAVGLAALLGHPLMRPGIEGTDFRDAARRYLSDLRRKGTRIRAVSGQALPPTGQDDDWLATVNGALLPLSEALTSGASLATLITRHRAAAVALTTPADGPPEIFQQEAGEALARFLDEAEANAEAFGDGPVPDYRALLNGLMRGVQLRPLPRAPHPRVAIRGIREARLESADTVILSGLNDGVWPAAPDPGPWLSRPMHGELGLPMPERAVGLSAHDFLQAACRPRVILTRSLRADGAPTVASRWLVRLETLLEGIGAADRWRAMQKRGAKYLALAAAQDRPATPVPRAERPRPTPPRSAMPDRLSVTQIETLVRDAYAIYARKILGLEAMEPLGREPDARERGTVLHSILEQFIARSNPWPGREAGEAMLLDVADKVLADADLPEDLSRIWRARVERFAGWFAAQEDQRRQLGAPAALEVSGAMTLSLPGGDFEIRAKADRIDRLPAGAAVYDYKTGQPPTEKQADAGLNHQLHVQAAMLAEGGFKDLPKLPAEEGAYIGLTGAPPGGKEERFDDLDAKVPEHMRKLAELIKGFRNGAPWISRRMPEKQAFESDYDHLARVAEWLGEDDA